ncbi:hypothetical protein CGGC5_v005389 [Colletotrichum fructicola Nara gc5]|uniref:Uncharacterized protein n=1 Tax=Colletotrichum fructicola (strain Nara gc5) TaxID=1213859 RepID=A0A7J6J9F1_COLFN|nr:hypothetical protein CGGC5_v005389 [Colletotrichum fructicola Nara gc5]
MQRARLIFWGAGLLSIANAQSTASITAPARFFFVYDSHPTGSLEASVVSYDPTDTTYQVACPTANEACQDEGYYPVNITHHQGSLWAGTNTVTAGTTKFWSCDLGTGSDDVLSDQYGWCSVGTTSGSSTMTGARSPVNTCFVEARSVVVAITAGLDKLGANKEDVPAFQQPDADRVLGADDLAEESHRRRHGRRVAAGGDSFPNSGAV